MNNKISVIIPTIQKTLEVLEQIIVLLSQDESVEEIILINNKVENPLDYDFPKLRIITPNENLYVNASWNLGIKESKCENFLLLNDDLLFGKNFCSNVLKSEIFNKESTGLIGMNPSMIKGFNELVNFKDEVAILQPFTNYLGTGDWGISIFGKKSTWFNIPDDLKIIYGDNFILYQNQLIKKINYSIVNLPCRHMHSVSSASPEFSNVVGQDIMNAKKYFPDFSSNKTIENVNALQKTNEKQKNDEYNIEIKDNVAVIRIFSIKKVISLKFKDNNNYYPKDKLFNTINNIIKDSDKNELTNNILDDLLKEQNS